MTPADLLQAALFASIAGPQWLFSGTSRRSRYWGFLVSLLCQPLWLYMGWTTHQWGVLAIAVVSIVLNVRGVINNR